MDTCAQPDLIDRIDRAVTAAAKFISLGAMAFLAFIMVIAFADVLSAKLFNTSIKNATELVQYGNIVVVFLAIAFVEIERGHTNIDLISSHYPKWLKKVLALFNNALGAGVCGFLGWRAVVLTADKYASFAKSSDIGFYLWPFAAVIVVGFWSLAAVYLWKLFKEIIGRNVPPQLGAPDGQTEENT